MGGVEGEGAFELLLRGDLVGGGKLFDVRGRQAHAFFGLCCDEQAFAAGLGQFGFDVAPHPNSERIGADGSGVGAKHAGDGVPKRGFAVAAVPVGDDEGFEHDFADRRQTTHPLHVADQVLISLEGDLESLAPQVRALTAWAGRGLQGDEVCRVVIPLGG